MNYITETQVIDLLHKEGLEVNCKYPTLSIRRLAKMGKLIGFAPPINMKGYSWVFIESSIHNFILIEKSRLSHRPQKRKKGVYYEKD